MNLARGWRDDPQQHPEQRSLATAVRPNDTKKFAAWHAAQGTSRCLLVSGKLVSSWLKCGCCQDLVSWHEAQSVPSAPR